ncbi:MAG: endonuclease MutS2, partial [Bacteroidales bacterium]|nr:endonuclease MutS2 [Bacteroidales bacterium]
MMIETKLSFDKIKNTVAAKTTNILANRMVQDVEFSSNYERVCRQLKQTEEMRQIILMENAFPSQDFVDMTDELARIKLPGTVIDLETLPDLRASLYTLSACVRFLMDDNGKKYPALHDLARRVELDPQLSKRLNKIVDDKGEIMDNASPELQEIRRQMSRKRNEVDLQIARSLSRAKREGWAPEDGEVTIRNGRLVIPMLDTHRRKIKGLIHDESATRQTAYLEPSEVVELNNDLRELEFDERHEILRILSTFTDYIRPQIPQLTAAYWFLARIDFLRAKALFALDIQGVLPTVNNRPMMDWIDARHPLLFLSHKEQGREVVPFSLQLNSLTSQQATNSTILIISGPNAGGKSVCLKSVGLIQYMLQCGFLPPCRETSEFGIFDRVFIDIGDQQSIENDLSTYSSHLQNMKELLAVADDHTLFLLDELGGGTEPRSGCAIAEALLEELCRRGAFGVVTTHFADLKMMADRFDNIINGAMLFDTERMMPLYRLAIGYPGSSFAFEIATKIGFPLDILEAAEEKAGKEMLNFEHQLQQLELDKQEIARKEQELIVSDNFLNEVIEKYQRLTEQLEDKKHTILSDAREEARNIIVNANRTVERTIADIKEANAERERTREAREKMRLEAERLETEQKKAQEQSAHHTHQRENRNSSHSSGNNHHTTSGNASAEKESLPMGPLMPGDIVRIDSGDTYGQLVEMKGKKAVVESNSLRMTIAVDRLTKTQKKAIPVDRTERQNNRFQSIYDDINEKRKVFSPTLDLRGHRAEEA